MNKKTNGQRTLLLLLSLLMTLSCMCGCAGGKTSGGAEGGEKKTISFTVVHGDGSEKTVSITTAGKTLREALEQEKLVAGEDGDFGLYVKTVDGETVDDSKQEWWCLTKGGESVMTGVDGVQIADGEAYEFTLTVGY